jgi:uncharacterized protein
VRYRLIRFRRRIYADEMTSPAHAPVVHLELHTANLGRALAFYSELFGWRVERIEAARSSYTALDLGDSVGGGAVECATDHPLWLPYVAVPDITAATYRAKRLGAGVLLEPREGPAGWRSVVAAPGAGEIALWESKT